MKTQVLTTILVVAGSVASVAGPPGVPTLVELAADWMAVKTLRNLPSVNNFAGGLKITGNLTAFA
jgi:hypothetical protein